jgi:hypothetical protein
MLSPIPVVSSLCAVAATRSSRYRSSGGICVSVSREVTGVAL